MAEYIEREALKERFKKRLNWLKKDAHDEYSGALLDGCETDMGLIDEISAADVALVRHGRWIEYQTPHIICCSCCDWGTGLNGKTDFCPNCGAKMDGGQDDG